MGHILNIGGISEMSNPLDCWRLVHDGKRVIALFDSGGVTATKYNLFIGTEAECMDEIKRLNLMPLPEI